MFERIIVRSFLIVLALFGGSSLLAQPVFVSVSPDDSTVTTASQVALTIEVAGATTLKVDGQLVTDVSGTVWTAGPYTLAEGERAFVLVAEDGAGGETQQLHRVVRDTLPPVVTIGQPTDGAIVANSSLTLAGTAIDPHLEEVRVNGALAVLDGAAFSYDVALSEGLQTLTVSASDDLGHVWEGTLDVTLDSQAPVVTVRESGQPLADASLFNRAVTVDFEVTDDTAVTVDALLDGVPFVSAIVDQAGEHEVSVTATDAAGNTTGVNRTFEIDLEAPSFVGFTPADGTLVGDAQLTLTGVVDGASAVSVDGQPATLTDSGWSAGPYTLVEGEREFTIVAVDAAGNSASAMLRIERDATAPRLIGLEPALGSVVASSPVEIRGIASDAHLLEVRVGGVLANLTGSQFVRSGVELAEGANTVEIVALDAVGRQTSSNHDLILDTQSPTVSIAVAGAPLNNGAVFAGSVTPEINASDATAVTIAAELDGAPYLPGTAIESDGSHQLEVTASDAAGHQTTMLVSFSLDLAAPVFEDIVPVDGHLTSADTLTLTGRAPGAVEVTVDGQPATLAGDGWSAGPFSLAEGERVFLLAATDGGGNVTQLTHRVIRDAMAPTLSFGQPATNALLAETAIDVSGTVSDERLDEVVVNGVVAEVTDGAFLASQVPLVEGANVLTVVATDQVGNSTQVERQVTADSTAPVVAISDPAAGTVTPESEITVSGSATDAHLDRVEVDGVTAQLQDGLWTLPVELSEGATTLTATAFDQLGHSATASVVVTRDSSAPEIQIETPAEGLFTPEAQISVNGTVAVEPDLTVTVGGLEATLTGASWSIDAVPLVEGENRLVARVTDGLGNQGTHTRVVWRDTQAPELLSVTPANGALTVPSGSAFRVRFSEPLAPPVDGAWSLRTLAGETLTSTALLDGDDLVLTPMAALPSATELVLELTAALTDRAGNPLPEAVVLEYTVADSGAPTAPQIDAHPSAVCASSLTLTGTSEPEAHVEIVGGASVGAARADAEGAFAVTLTLLPEGPNHLQAVARDASDNVSPPTLVDVVHDCTAPVVLGALRDSDSFRISLSEEADPSTLSGTVRVLDAGQPVAGTVVAVGHDLVWTATTTLAAVPLLLEVEGGLADFAGNTLEFPFRQLFDGSLGSSFLSGTVIDDATGRPLEGVRVVVTATGGVALSAPLPEQTTTDDGRFAIPVVAGTHDVTFARLGYTPVFRIVTTTDGAGTDVFDPRLTRAAQPQPMDGSGGSVTGLGDGSVPTLEVPAGALAAATAVRLTAVSDQGLAALLPYGWTPMGAAWVDLDSASLLASATLELPVLSPDGTVLEAASLDLATLQWRSLGAVTVSGGAVTMPVDSEGAWAAVMADSGSLAPPVAIAGQILGSAPAPMGNEVSGANLSFDPEIVLPTQQSRVRVLYQLDAEVPSGLPLTLTIEEELELLDGSVRRISPYSADLLVYRDVSGEPFSAFRLQPSSLARALPVKLGAENVSVRGYGDESVRGNVLGPDGGVVTSTEGDRVELPSGALDQPTAITLRRAAAADLPLAQPVAGTVDGVLDLDLAGQQLSTPSELSLALETPPPAGTPGLLLQAIEIAEVWRWRAVAELAATASGWSTKTIDDADLAWPGVVRGGSFVFLRLDAEPRYVRGRVLDPDGLTVEGAVVEATDVVEWLQLSAADGRFVLPITEAAATVSASRATTGNGVSVALPSGLAGERIDLDLLLQVVAPWVAEITPADGASGVLVGVNPTVRFSEPVDRASLDGAIELRRDGQPLAMELEHQGTLVTLLPQASLAPATEYQLWIGSGVRDLQGYGLLAPLSTTFTTETVILPAGVDRERIFLAEPDPLGLARVEGLSGAAPAGALVFVENLTSFSTTESVAAASDGSFLLTIGASLTDQLLLHVLIEGGNEIVILLTPFLGADLQTGLTGPGAGQFTTVDGLTMRYEAGTFDGPSRVRVTPVVAGTYEPAADFTEITTFRLEIDGAQPRRPLEVVLPGAASGEGSFWLLRRRQDLAELPWMVHSELALDDGRLKTVPLTAETQASESSAGAASTGSAFEAPSQVKVLSAEEAQRAVADLGQWSILPSSSPTPETKSELVASAEPVSAEKAATEPVLADYLVGVSRPGIYQAARTGVELRWIGFPFRGEQDLVVSTESLPGVVLALDAVDRAFLPLGAGGLPIKTAESAAQGVLAQKTTTPTTVEIRVLDFAGIELFRVTVDQPDQELVVLEPSDLPNPDFPVPVGGGPIRFHTFVIVEGQQDIAAGIEGILADEGLTVRGSTGSVGAGVDLRLLNLEGEEMIFGDASEGGSFELEASGVEAGDRFVLAVSAKLLPNEPIQIEFSEALGEDPPGLNVIGPDGELELRKEPLGSWARVRLHGTWKVGESHTLELLPGLSDAAGRNWGKHLSVPFEVVETRIGESYALDRANDIARLGSLLFVAAERDGLIVVDASDPRELKPFLAPDTAIELSHLESGLPVYGVDAGSHGRVVAVGAGDQRRGELLILDPEALVRDATEVPEEAILGRTIVTEPRLFPEEVSHLLEGRLMEVEIFNRDLSNSWTVGDGSPPFLNLDPPEPPNARIEFPLTASGAAAPGHPVTFRNLTTGERKTTRADDGGQFSVAVQANRGDRMELLRNELSLAYVAGYDAGVVTVDLNAVEAAEDWVSEPLEAKDLLTYNTHYQVPSEVLCPSFAYSQRFDIVDVRVLPAVAEGEPWGVLGLVEQYGLISLGAQAEALDKMVFLHGACAEVGDNRKVGGLDVLLDYRFDFDGDGPDPAEVGRDYALVVNTVGEGSNGWLMIFDVSRRDQLKLVGRIELPGQATRVTADALGRRAFVSGLGGGVYIVDLDRWPGQNADGETPEIWPSDLVVERLDFGEDVRAPTLVAAELGLAFAGGRERGLTTLAVGIPQLSLVATGERGLKRVERLAPFGVPTAPESEDPESEELPGLIRVQLQMPGGLADGQGEIKVELAGIGPGGLPVTELDSELVEQPHAELTDSDALVLQRQSDEPLSEGFNVFLSDPVVLLADVRASVHFERKPNEDEVCRRCDLVDEGVYPSDDLPSGELFDELLSGHFVRARFVEGVTTILNEIYDPSLMATSEAVAESVPWDLSPSPAQEPVTYPATTALAAPGTLLHSGEMTRRALDFSVRGRGIDVSFARVYRSQTVGNGPMGPGWDHVYRMRLRPLPNGDIDFFDGTGRRETFVLNDEDELEPPMGRHVQLQKHAEGFTLIGSGYERWRFDRFGRLISQIDSVRTSDETGNEITFHYDAQSRLVRIVDDLERETHFQYEDGRLTEIEDSSGRDFVYSYDSIGRLTSFETPMVDLGSGSEQRLETTYEYATPSVDFAGHLDRRDDLISETDAEGETWLRLDYDLSQPEHTSLVKSQEWGSGTVTLSYDFDLGETQLQDRRGILWKIGWTSAGQLGFIEDDEGRRSSSQYNEHGALKQRTDPRQTITTLTYGSDDPRQRGNFDSVTVAPSDSDSAPVVVEILDRVKRSNRVKSWRDQHGAQHLVITFPNELPRLYHEAYASPHNATSSMDYDDYGRLTELTDANGSKTTLTYGEEYLQTIVRDAQELNLTTEFLDTDPRGNVKRWQDARGIIHEAEYNELDWPLRIRQGVSGSTPVDLVTELEYNGNGQVVTMRRSSSGGMTEVRYVYGQLGELERTESEIAPGGEVIVEKTDYDENLNPIRLTNGAGEVIEQDFNSRNLLHKRRMQADNGDEIVEVFEYDAKGFLETYTDPRQKVWTTEFDGHGRLVEKVDPMGAKVEMDYTAGGLMEAERVFGFQGELLSRSTREYDVRGRLERSVEHLWTGDAGAGTELATEYTYDSDSNLLTVTGPGVDIEYRYDTAGRQIYSRDAGGNIVELDLDPLGLVKSRLSKENVSNGDPVPFETTYTYDALGRALEERLPHGGERKWSYDPRGNVLQFTDADGLVWAWTYDGLDRALTEQRPGGVDLTIGWDGASRRESYTDALGNESRWVYDRLGRPTFELLNNSVVESLVYDEAGNPTRIDRPDGSVVIQTFDDVGRLESRTAQLPSGITSEVEGYLYDGLGRVLQHTAGPISTVNTYDSLSRKLSETTAGMTVGYQYDLAGNVIAMTYPSGRVVEIVPDALNRPFSVAWTAPDSPSVVASFSFRGPDKLASRSLGDVLELTTFDAGNRPALRQATRSNKLLVGENLNWSSGSRLLSSQRLDLNGLTRRYGYSGGRLSSATRTESPDSMESIGISWASVPAHFSYLHDGAQNLLSMSFENACESTGNELPLDGSGWNRPRSSSGKPLQWSARQELARKGNLEFTYRWDGRPRRLTREGETVATYRYDAMGRRIERQVGSDTYTTVWAGWQPIEEYKNGQLVSRRTYGVGMDELVRLEVALGGSGPLNQEYLPFYDAVGNLVLLTDTEGKPIERYAYGPYGQRWILVDSTPPEIEQVRVRGDELWIEFSEEVQLDRLRETVENGTLKLTKRPGVDIELVVEQPVNRGRAARRRVVLREVPGLEESEWPTADDEVTLHIPAEAVVDLFENEAVAQLLEDYLWPEADAVLEDTADPVLLQACLTSSSRIELEFSEPVDEETIDEILVDASSVEWNVSADGYRLTSTVAGSAGSHELHVGTGVLDLAGNPLAASVSEVFTIAAGKAEVIYSAPYSGEISDSAAGNPFGFKGLPQDPESGLIYMRHRYYDPEMGRFITPDPLGFVDGPGRYAFVGGDPVNFSDPMGLFSLGLVGDSALQSVRDQSRAAMRAEDRETRRGALALVQQLQGLEGVSQNDIQMALNSYLESRPRYDQYEAYREVQGLTGAGSGVNESFEHLAGIGIWADFAEHYVITMVTAVSVLDDVNGLYVLGRAGVRAFSRRFLQSSVPRRQLTRDEFHAVTQGWFGSRDERNLAWKVYKEAYSTRETGRYLAMGRRPDTKSAASRGYQILDVQEPDVWKPAVNRAWVMGAIDAGRPIRFVSKFRVSTFWHPPGGKFLHTVTRDELLQLEAAGFKFPYHKPDGWVYPPGWRGGVPH